MVLQMYERVESIDLERFLKKPINKRDWYLYHTPPDELVCYFSAMDAEEIIKRFSKEAIVSCFKKLPPDDLIHLCNHVSPKHMSYFLSPHLFSKKWNDMRPDILLYEFKRDANLVFNLIQHQFISYQEMSKPFYHVTMGELSKLYTSHTLFSKLFHPLLDDMYITFHNLAPELVRHILSFLF